MIWQAFPIKSITLAGCCTPWGEVRKNLRAELSSATKAWFRAGLSTTGLASKKSLAVEGIFGLCRRKRTVDGPAGAPQLVPARPNTGALPAHALPPACLCYGRSVYWAQPRSSFPVLPAASETECSSPPGARLLASAHGSSARIGCSGLGSSGSPSLPDRAPLAPTPSWRACRVPAPLCPGTEPGRVCVVLSQVQPPGQYSPD